MRRFKNKLARGPRAVAYARGTLTIEMDINGESLRAPDRGGVPHKWVPCSCCGRLVDVPCRVVSTICEDCAQPCATPGCGLFVYEHFNEQGEWTPCECGDFDCESEAACEAEEWEV